jgi:hypothetical protein
MILSESSVHGEMFTVLAKEGFINADGKESGSTLSHSAV